MFEAKASIFVSPKNAESKEREEDIEREKENVMSAREKRENR